MEKMMLRRNDYIYSFWMGPGGVFIWLIKRDDEIFINGMFNMRTFYSSHFPFEHPGQVGAISSFIKEFFINCIEYPCFSIYHNIDSKWQKMIQEQFSIFEKTQRQMEEERHKKQKEQGAEA